MKPASCWPMALTLAKTERQLRQQEWSGPEIALKLWLANGTKNFPPTGQNIMVIGFFGALNEIFFLVSEVSRLPKCPRPSCSTWYAGLKSAAHWKPRTERWATAVRFSDTL